MRFRFPTLLVIALCVCALATSAAAAANAVATATPASMYSWLITPVEDGAELATLFCRACGTPPDLGGDVPLLAALRDTLGDDDPGNDRLTSVWLLTYSRPSLAKRALSAMPFFYWKVADGSTRSSAKGSAPLFDLNSPQRPMIETVAQDIIQWSLLDPSALPVRAISRAYRTNASDHERLHIEQALTYLRAAPSDFDGESALTPDELHTLTARLELTKTLLGGFVTERQAARVGEQSAIRQESIRSRNWELLRQCADKTGLYFEPLDLAGTSGQYAILWFSPEKEAPPAGPKMGSVWKLLHLKDPRRDDRLKSANAPFYFRNLDENGSLLPFGSSGAKQVKLFPVGVYSLNYPKLPLLLVDFSGSLHMKWREITQRSINEVTAGVIGISHFTNWYYYVAADAYDFIASRHGSATNQSDRLDSYSQFRASLQLDAQLDPGLRRQMQERVDSLAVNPLESAPRQEMMAAVARYAALQHQVESGELATHVDKNRRLELARAGETRTRAFYDQALHVASFGLYTHRAPAAPETVNRVDSYRRAQNHIDFLARLSEQGTPPEIVYNSAKIQHSIVELKEVMPEIQSDELRARAASVLSRMRDLSQDDLLRADCSTAIASLKTSVPLHEDRVMLKPSALKVPASNGAAAGLDTLR